MDKIRENNTKIVLSKDICEIEAIKYVAFRHGVTPLQALMCYFVQCGILDSSDNDNSDCILEPNEIALFHDLGVHPSYLEITYD